MAIVPEVKSEASDGFARRAALTTILIVGLLLLHRLPVILRHSPVGHRLGQLIGPMSNNAMTRDNVDALVSGYYEGLRPDGSATGAGLPGERDDIQFRNDFLRYEMRPNLKRSYRAGMRITNSQGMANPEYSLAKPPHTRRIAVLGDSLTLGPYGHDYVASLEDQLNQNCRTPEIQNYQILNFSVYGYSIVQMMDAGLDKAPRFHPDVYVVAMTNLETMETEGWRTHVGSLVTSGKDLKYDYLRQVVSEAGVQPGNHLVAIRKKLQPYFIPVTRWALKQVRDHAQAQGASMVIFMIPIPIDPDISSSDFDSLRKAADPVGVPIVDLRDTFRSVNLDDVRVDPVSDIHPNVLGHAVIADNLYDKLREQPEASLALAGHPCEIASSRSGVKK
jgi:hypothetical protein